MTDDTQPIISDELMPRPEEQNYDLHRALNAVVSVRAQVPEDAFTASILGTERVGHGVATTHNGLIVTIGYLVAEAEEIWLVTQSGEALQGHVVAYDYESGFGLIQPLGKLSVPGLEMGHSADLRPGESVVVAGFGGREQSIAAHVITKQEFAGYWEYVLDEAIFTAPTHPNWGGAALLDPQGRIAGIGSLYIDKIAGSQLETDGNMIVPIDLLHPILDELMSYGRRKTPPRPWLGMFTTEMNGRLIVAGVFNEAPADQAGIRAGDVVLELADEPVADLAQFFKRIWSLGPAGITIPLKLNREGQVLNVGISSTDRQSHWKAPDLH
ncbi:MAG: S1C family serine protease [Pseudomonadota bacterium]